ncbi:hypothetical protein APM49_21035 [Salmonella enterica subsp. arizonae serovar 40:z4,z23:-]|nr:hypothetical protein [Salmonella enterica]ECU0367083.1 hypothetical protein [Salmonella enterica subsp. enterica serovar Newport]ECU5742074.1 hypothetical protein [Salmonella enterica subsp. arizonae serovar 40:z4,z23:-]EAR5801590.1 hypothetical protein [Salmonella enterica]EBJ4736906.1 hypothetical protein [Salmonella enterica]
MSVWGIEGAGQTSHGLRRRGGTASLAPVIRDSSDAPVRSRAPRTHILVQLYGHAAAKPDVFAGRSP